MKTGELAKKFRVSTQTIRNWRADGMPVAGTDDDGHPIFDPTACEAWKKKHKPGFTAGRHGGRRRGAGRKRKSKHDGPTFDDVLEEQEQADREVVLDLETLVARAKRGELTAADAATSGAAIQTIQRRVALDKELGKLVDAEEVQAEFRRHIERAKVVLEGIAPRLAPQIAVLEPTESLEARIRGMIAAEIRKALSELAEASDRG